MRRTNGILTLLGVALLLLTACGSPQPSQSAPVPAPAPAPVSDTIQSGPSLYAVSWGCGVGRDSGQCTVPTPPAGVSYTAVSAGQYHSLALRSDGQVAAWGCGGEFDFGQCTVPTLPAGVTYTAVSAGHWHSMALRSDGSVVAWGCNIVQFNPGQCAAAPALPAGVTYVAVAAGTYHSLALRSDGQVTSWGCVGFDFGQCAAAPTVPAGVTYTAVAAGQFHTMALRSDGQVVAWGCGGNFDQGQCTVPALPNGVTYVSISALLGSHSMALRSDGQVITWGCFGRSTGRCVAPPSLPAGVSYTAVVSGRPLSMALRSDGQVALWAGCSATNSVFGICNIPTLPAGSGFAVVTMGAFHVLGLVTDAGPPVTSIVPSPSAPNGSGGWYTTAVTLQVGAIDGLSGVAETRCALNPASAPASFDALPTGCAYSGSGASVSADGSHILYAASRDNAGNKEAVKRLEFRIDTTKPALAPVVSPNPVPRFASATATPNASDGLSGIATQSCPAVSTSSTGAQSVTCTATDRAGNTATASAAYTVVSSSQSLSSLRSQVQGLSGLGFVNRTLLLATLSQAQVFLSNGVRSGAVSSLNTFIGQVDGIRGISGGLTNAQANSLIAQANLIIQSINAGG